MLKSIRFPHYPLPLIQCNSSWHISRVYVSFFNKPSPAGFPIQIHSKNKWNSHLLVTIYRIKRAPIEWEKGRKKNQLWKNETGVTMCQPGMRGLTCHWKWDFRARILLGYGGRQSLSPWLTGLEFRTCFYFSHLCFTSGTCEQ